MSLLLEWLLQIDNLQISISVQQTETMLPYELSVISAIVLLLLAVPGLRNFLMPFFARENRALLLRCLNNVNIRKNRLKRLQIRM